MRYLPILAVFLVLILSAGTAFVITGAPGLIDEVPPSPVAPPPTPVPSPVVISVEPGQGVQDIADLLEAHGVIDSAIQFRVLVSLMGYERLLQAGEYEFDPDTPTLEVVYRMRRGLISPLFVTVVEGWRLEEIADAVAAGGTISREDFLEAAVAGNYDFDILRGLGSQRPLEGYLYPATYFYGRDDTAEDLIERMVRAMDESFSEEMRAEAEEQGLSVRAVLTIASIIEREAQIAEEKPIMAQVFLRRLRLGIPLEADPTVQYAAAQDPESIERFGYWKADLTLEDLEIDSPYNTYRVTGLPPGPIAAPGLDSIEAVIDPADTNYLYFVARPDGSHAFAETLEEHQRNVEEFLR